MRTVSVFGKRREFNNFPIRYIREYLRMRSNLLMNMLLEEKEKKSTKDDV